jgi:preprotein translocase subunit SecD
VRNGVEEVQTVKTEEIINTATIRGVFKNDFQITGLTPGEAHDLALLLRAGALAAPVYKIDERTIGPSLGQDNIERGFEAIVIGFLAVIVFMAVYYKWFGVIANAALLANLVFIVALLSLLQASLTLPGIAGIVLTVGMAVDANVLIFERIREELVAGVSPQAAINAGYEKAFSSIADANITTLIAAVVLFAFGTGPVKGFAITLSLGIVTSMFTAIVGTRALVNLIFGGRRLVKVPV